MLDELLPEDKRRLHELEMSLSELERNNPNVHYSDVAIAIKEMTTRLEYLDAMCMKESKARRTDMRRRVQHLKSTFVHIRSSFDKYEKRHLQNNPELQKQILFGSAVARDPELFDLEMAENDSLGRSSSMINDYINSGRETLSELTSQRERLKSVQTKVYDILNLLGVSNSIMRAVERRDFYDKWIVFGGMIVVTILLLVIYIYL